MILHRRIQGDPASPSTGRAEVASISLHRLTNTHLKPIHQHTNVAFDPVIHPGSLYFTYQPHSLFYRPSYAESDQTLMILGSQYFPLNGDFRREYEMALTHGGIEAHVQLYLNWQPHHACGFDQKTLQATATKPHLRSDFLRKMLDDSQNKPNAFGMSWQEVAVRLWEYRLPL